MSRQHVLMIAEPSATAFLFGDSDRRERARANVFGARSKRARATPITTTETEAPADARRVDRRGHEARQVAGAINNRVHRGGATSQKEI
jgi:hypothetical protein